MAGSNDFANQNPIQQVFTRWIPLALRVLIGVVAVVIALAAFGYVAIRPFMEAADREKQTEIVVMNWSGGGGQAEEQIVKGLIDDFMKKHPEYTVKRINPGDAASLYTKLQTMLAAGTPPDLFYMGSEKLGTFAEKDLLMPIEELIAADKEAGVDTLDLDDFYEATVDCFRFDGVKTGHGPLYGVPKDFTTIGFYFNKDVFDRANLPYPADDWTWDEFIETARKIGELDGVTGAELVTWPAMVRAILWTEGLKAFSDDFTESYLDEPEQLAVLQRLYDWRHNETNTLTSGKSKVATGETVFLTGKIGLAGPFGRWVVPTYRQGADFDWDFAPLPRGKVKANCVFTVAWSMAKHGPNREGAWKLLKHLCGPEGQAKAAELGLAIPTLKSVSHGPSFVQPDKLPLRDDLYLTQAEYARAMQWPADQRFESRMGNRLDESLKTGSVSVQEAVKKLEEEWANDRNTPLNRTDFPAMPWGTIAYWILIPTAVLAGLAALIWLIRRPSPMAFREELAGVSMVSPWVIGFLSFMAFPIVLSLLLAFTKWNGILTLDHAQWVGTKNFEQLFAHDPKFWISLGVTLYYAAIAVPLGQLIALGAALLLNQNIILNGFFRSAWYLPSVLAGVAVAILWRWVFDGDNGLLNQLLDPALAYLTAGLNHVGFALTEFANAGRGLLNAIGLGTWDYATWRPWEAITAPRWIDDDAKSFGPPAFAIMSFWTVGGPMMIYLAGLKGVPKELYEAASIDGTGNLGRFTNVTMPMLSPVIFFNVIMAVIGSFQVFTQAFVMTGGGPGDATRFYVLYLYEQAFNFADMGYASAMAWLLLLVILGLTLTMMWGSKRFVYYEALR